MTGCICLIASERKARFKGLVARLMQPFIGI
jgi:anti-sigma factor ChrR (cupin superfamily)